MCLAAGLSSLCFMNPHGAEWGQELAIKNDMGMTARS